MAPMQSRFYLPEKVLLGEYLPVSWKGNETLSVAFCTKKKNYTLMLATELVTVLLLYL